MSPHELLWCLVMASGGRIEVDDQLMYYGLEDMGLKVYTDHARATTVYTAWYLRDGPEQPAPAVVEIEPQAHQHGCFCDECREANRKELGP